VAGVTETVTPRPYGSGMRLRFVFAFVLLLGACGGHQVVLTETAPPTFAREPGGWEDAVVERIVDGDTIVVRIERAEPGPGAGDVGAGEHRVRLVGVDTPESVDPRRPVECFGREAAAATAALLDGQRVRLVKDVEDRDAYDRLLRYVYLGDEMANARLVANGYATAYTYPPNVRHSELFVQLEREARERDRGLWSPDTCNGKD
jgi:micrococcal nuclease